jgi:hypothetical protein
MVPTSDHSRECDDIYCTRGYGGPCRGCGDSQERMRWPELLDVMAYVGDVMTESRKCRGYVVS